MKLLSYHIENYGKIHDRDGNFSDGITCFCEKNGFGKTTLASFIKAMFYGLPSYTTKTKSFDDRQHFYPFAGGKFGGNLTFEMQGKTYKIERFFDKKSNKGDEVRVYCNGSLFFGFGEEIGKEIFGLDEESFKKTVFITAEEMEISSTHSINEKLNRGVDSSDEEDDYEAAVGALEKAKKSLKAARGNNDRISEKKNEIAELTAQIGNLKDMGEGLQEEYVERERLSKELSVLEKEQKSANERNLLLQKWENADRMEGQAAEKEKALAALKAKYPLGVPSAEERKTLNECLQTQNALQGALNTAVFSAEKEETLRVLEEKFREGVPTENELSEKQRDIHRLTALSAEADRLSEREKTQKEKLLESKFCARMPQESELAEMRLTAEEYKRKDARIKELSATLLSASPTEVKKTGKTYFVLFALAAFIFLAGGFLLFVDKIAGGVAIAVAAAMAVGAIVKAKSTVNSTMPPSNVGIDLATLQAEARLTEEKLRAFTVPYGYYGNAGAVYDFSALEDDLKAYKEYLSSEEARKARLSALSEEKERMQGQIRAFLAGYGEEAEDLQNGLNGLRAAVSSYRSLQTDKAETERSGQGFRARRAENEKRVAAILEKYGLAPSAATMYGLNELEIDRKALSDLENEVRTLRENLTEYKEKNALLSRPEGEETDADELHERLSLLRKKLTDCDKRIAETERFVEKLSDYESALERAQEQLKEYKEKHGLLADTISALQTAEQNLKDRYIAPIKDRFSHYAEAIERVLDEKVSMDKDFRIVFERGGEDRSERHLSAGERSICALCLRLALIDNMYENESPFIIMDDPFVHLDEVHLERTLRLMEELAKDRQIVYFCCHDSRQTSAGIS